MPAAVDTSSTVDDGFSVTVKVDEGENTGNESTYKKRKVDREDDMWAKSSAESVRQKAVLLSRELDNKIISAAQKLLLSKVP